MTDETPTEDTPTDDNAAEAPTEARSIDPKLLEALVCPVSRGPLRYDRTAQELVSERAALAYPIRDGIPIMLEDEARQID